MIRLSPFRLQMFLQCKRLYRFFYLDGIKEHYDTPKPYIVMGEHVHRALDNFYKLPSKERSEDKLHELLRQSWRLNRSCFTKPDQEKKWGQKALNMLSLYHQSHKHKDTPKYLEQYVDHQVDSSLTLLGKIDRIDEDSKGALHIIDYKTGKERASTHLDNLQLIIYTYLVSKKYSQPVSKATYLYLASNTAKDIAPTDDDLEAALLEIKEYAKTIEQEEEFAPNPNPYCKNCDFLSICPARPK